MKSFKITGVQLEKIIDLCNEFDLFDLIFEPEEAALTDKEQETYSEYVSRKTMFEKTNKDKTAVFATSGEEDRVIEKVYKVFAERNYNYKKSLLKKENREFVKQVAKIFNENVDLNDIKELMNEVSGKIPFLKAEFNQM